MVQGANQKGIAALTSLILDMREHIRTAAPMHIRSRGGVEALLLQLVYAFSDSGGASMVDLDLFK